jgi:hypothetical protein
MRNVQECGVRPGLKHRRAPPGPSHESWLRPTENDRTRYRASQPLIIPVISTVTTDSHSDTRHIRTSPPSRCHADEGNSSAAARRAFTGAAQGDDGAEVNEARRSDAARSLHFSEAGFAVTRRGAAPGREGYGRHADDVAAADEPPRAGIVVSTDTTRLRRTVMCQHGEQGRITRERRALRR